MSQMTTRGTHLIVEFSGCMPAAIGNNEFIRSSMIEAALAAGAHVLGDQFHEFKPSGCSGVVLIAESHLSIHTWPDEQYAAVDFYTCGNINTFAAVDKLRDRLGADTWSVMHIQRGLEIARGLYDSNVFHKSRDLAS